MVATRFKRIRLVVAWILGLYLADMWCFGLWRLV